MPYRLEQSGSGFYVVGPSGRHSKKPLPRRQAVRQMRALYAAEKSAGTTAGAPLAGPGGLLGTPGLGKRDKATKIVGNLYRGETGQFQAGGADASAPSPAKRRPPAKTDQERAERRQADQAERQTARAQEQAQNRAEVLRSLNIAPDGAEALAKLRAGEQPDPAAIARAGFVAAGLVEQAQDGSYRMTPSGRALLSAADAGDRGRAGDTISRGRDRVGTRRQRAERKKKVPPAASAAPAKKKKPAIDIAQRMRRINRRIARVQQSQKAFTVFKDASGAHRWIARTTTAYRDRDGEIITTKALEADAARMQATGQYGPLRYWHVGQPDPSNSAAPWGPGLDIGMCDYSIVIGRTSIESGTFNSAAIGEAYARHADEYEISPGFFHPPDQPNVAGEFDLTRRFERSTVPTQYGRASNLFTGLTVKEQRMDPQEYERRMKAFAADMQGKGVPPEVAGAVIAGMQQSDKSAQAQGIAYKSDDAPAVYTAPDGSPGIIVDGRFVTLKAAPPPFAEKAPMPAEEMVEAGETEERDGLDDMGMDDAALVAAIADAVVAKIAPLFGDMKMSEMKAMFATKDDARAQQVAQLEATLKSVQDQLAALTGMQPSASQADIEAALKSAGPQPPPDPNAPQVPNDPSRPFAALAAATMPQLYQQNGAGQFNGWMPQPPIAPQS